MRTLQRVTLESLFYYELQKFKTTYFSPLEERDHLGKTYQLKWTILENMKVYVVTNSSNNEAF